MLSSDSLPLLLPAVKILAKLGEGDGLQTQRPPLCLPWSLLPFLFIWLPPFACLPHAAHIPQVPLAESWSAGIGKLTAGWQ